MCPDATTPTGGNNTGADTGADTGAVCPECGEPVRPVPPTTPRPADEPMASWSHLDGEPLCPVIGPHGYRPAYPQFTHTPPPRHHRPREHPPAPPHPEGPLMERTGPLRPDDITPPGADGSTHPDPGTAAVTGTGGATAELIPALIPALWVGSTAQIHGPGTGDYAGRVVRVVSDRGRRWTVETSDGTQLKIDPRSLRETDQRFVSAVPTYVPGSVVTITPPIAVYSAEQRFAVIAVRATSLTVAKLGGDGGITYRVPPAACHPADPDA